MAHVQFDLTHDFGASARTVWDELVDWKAHEKWIPATQVEVHTSGDPASIGAEFTAWSGLGRKLALEDRMRVDELAFDTDAESGFCKVTKLGPMITGWASFSVAPSGSGSQLVWTEEVDVPYAPQFLSPVLAKIGVGGFRFGMKRLNKLLAET